jgi:hypothetical protein
MDFGIDAARVDRVDANPLLCVSSCCILRQQRHPTLTRVTRGCGLCSHETPDRGKVHDGTAAVFGHERYDRAHSQKDTGQRYSQCLVPAFEVLFEEGVPLKTPALFTRMDGVPSFRVQ